MKLGVIGVGYVGLVSGACLSDFGHTVYCIDNDEEKINSLNNGSVPIYEPGLPELVSKNVAAGRLTFGTDLKNIIENVDLIFLAVGTPLNSFNGEADLSNLFSVVEKISKVALSDLNIVIKSTVPVGTNKKVKQIFDKNTKLKAEVISNPEFLREGAAIEDFMKPDRVIVGHRSENVKKLMIDVYKPLYLREFPLIFTDPESAEVIKYASNAFLAMKISFINEVAYLCEKVGADVKEVSKGIGLDGRIGNKFLHAGPGYGGSCFPKDTSAFVKTGLNSGARQTIIEAVINVNKNVKLRMVEKIFDILNNEIHNKVIVILGVTFKPNTDDLRDSPSLTIIPKLQQKGGVIRAVDPKGKFNGSKVLKNIQWYDDAYKAAEKADLIVTLTEWNEFRALDLKKLSTKMKNKALADLRNLYVKEEVLKSGFIKYVGVGK